MTDQKMPKVSNWLDSQKFSKVGDSVVAQSQKSFGRLESTFQDNFQKTSKQVLDNIRDLHAKRDQQKAYHENPILAIRPAIEQEIKEFENYLAGLDDPSLYVGLWLAAFGQQRLIFVELIEFHEPCLIIFHGFNEEGNPLKLIQHISQLSFLLEARNLVKDEPRRPIGFRSYDDAQ